MTALPTFPGQVSPPNFLTAFFYIFATIGVMFDLFAVALLDAGSVHPKNLVDTLTQKIICAMIGSLSFLVIGYGVWNWQFYQALGAAHPLRQAISDWWLGGANLSTPAQHLDPAAVPAADTQQVFSVFFCAFGAVTSAFIHSAGLERMKPLPCYVMSAIAGGVLVPMLTYLSYGSASPLTNAGLHDFVGDFALYIFVGVWALVLAARLGPRLRRNVMPPNFALFGAGIFLLLIGIPMLVVGSGMLEPGRGYFGISLTDSGLGVVFVNVFAAFGAGAISGAAISYRLKTPLYAVLGPISGYVACSPLFDIAVPWEAMLVAAFAPFVTMGCTRLVNRFGIDEPKIAALALGPGVYGALAAGIIGAGDATGGYFGITTGPYAFQHAHISFGMQLIGVLEILAFSLVTAFTVVTLVDKTLGLRVDRATEIRGLDQSYWGVPAAGMATPADHLATAPGTAD